MQFHSPTRFEQTSRTVTPSPKFQKLEIEKGNKVKSPTVGKDYAYIILKIKTPVALGVLVKHQGKVFKSKNTMRALLRKIKELKPALNSRNVAILLHGCSKASFPEDLADLFHGILSTLADLALVHLHESTAKDISMVLHSLTKRCFCNKELFQKAAEYSIGIIGDFKPEGLSNILMALAKMNAYNKEFFDRSARVAILAINEFNSQSLCYVADAFSRSEHHDKEVFSAIAKKAVPFLDTFRPQDLVLLINAFANMKHPSDALFNEASKTIIERVQYFNGIGLARLASSFAHYGHKNEEIFDVIAMHLVPQLGSLDAKGLSLLVNAFAAFNHPQDELISSISALVIKKMPLYEPKELIIVANAFGNVIPIKGGGEVLDAAAEAATLSLDEYFPRELARLGDVFSMAGFYSESSDSLFCEIASLILSESDDLAHYSSDDPHKYWDSNSLISVAVAFAEGNVWNTKLMELIASTILNRADILPVDAAKLKRLMTAFAGYETPSAVSVMELVLRGFMSMDKEAIELSLVLQLVNSLPFGQRNDILPYGIMKRVLELSLEKGNKEQVDMVFEIFGKFSKLGLDRMVHRHRGIHETTTTTTTRND